MHLIDQHDVFKNLEQIFQKVGRFFTTWISSLNVRRTRPCFLYDPNHLVLNSSCLLYKCQTFLSLSQSSLISVATQQVAGVKGHRQLNDFTPEWVRPPVHLSEACEQKELSRNWVLVFLLLLTSEGTLNKLCNLSEPQFLSSVTNLL